MGDPEHPYPEYLAEPATLSSGRELILRPIRHDDAAAHYELLSRLAPEDIRFRFFGHIKTMSPAQMARYTHIDYEHEMAFIASAPKDGGGYETLGVVRAIPNSDGSAAEFAIVVRSDIKGQGLGWKLLEKMIRYCRDKGVRVLTGQVLRDNSNMLKFVKGLGFHRVSHPPGDDAVEVEIELDLS